MLFGGDLVWGPWPRETLELARSLGDRARFILGNTDRLALEGDSDSASWTRERLTESQRAFVAAWPTDARAGRRRPRPDAVLPRDAAERRGRRDAGDAGRALGRRVLADVRGARRRLRSHAPAVRRGARRAPCRESGQRRQPVRSSRRLVGDARTGRRRAAPRTTTQPPPRRRCAPRASHGRTSPTSCSTRPRVTSVIAFLEQFARPTGLYGGAFDPPHNGHVAVARAAKAHFGLPQLVVLVAAAPGHRDVHATAEERLELARAAFPDDDVRLDRHARTIDLLRSGEFDDPLFVIGADQFCELLTWKEPHAVLELARLAVATRPGVPRERIDAVLAGARAPGAGDVLRSGAESGGSRDVRALAGGRGAARRARPAGGRGADRGARPLRAPIDVRRPWLHCASIQSGPSTRTKDAEPTWTRSNKPAGSPLSPRRSWPRTSSSSTCARVLVHRLLRDRHRPQRRGKPLRSGTRCTAVSSRRTG